MLARYLIPCFYRASCVRWRTLTSISDSFYYSSSDTYDDAGVFSTYDMAFADTIILPLLSTDSMTLRSTGSAYSRAEKTREILSIPRIGERLDVCVNHGHKGAKINCGVCWKCCRIELTLEAFGALRQFEPVFDLARLIHPNRFVKVACA